MATVMAAAKTVIRRQEPQPNCREFGDVCLIMYQPQRRYYCTLDPCPFTAWSDAPLQRRWEKRGRGKGGGKSLATHVAVSWGKGDEGGGEERRKVFPRKICSLLPFVQPGGTSIALDLKILTQLRPNAAIIS